MHSAGAAYVLLQIAVNCFLVSEKVIYVNHLPNSLDLSPCDFFFISNAQNKAFWKDI